MSVTLERVKAQVRITNTREDALLTGYIAAARAWAIRYTGDNYDENAEDLDHAQLLLIGHWFEHREAAAEDGKVSELPFAVEFLAKPFRTPTLR